MKDRETESESESDNKATARAETLRFVIFGFYQSALAWRLSKSILSSHS